MKGIAKFYTWFWIIYFPVCIAFTNVVNFDWSDEILTVALLGYAFMKQRFLVKDKGRTTEINIYIGLMIFYLVYSLLIQVTTLRGVYLDLLQQLRPYAVFYLTWMMAPDFSPKQKKRIKWVMLLSFWGYLILFKIKPSVVTPYGGGESAALGQIALCCAMIYYLFSKQTKRNRNIAILIMLLGLVSGKSKYFGECVVFIALMMFVKSKINFTSVSTLLKVAALGCVVIFFTWTKFNAYYVEGFQSDAAEMARPLTYETGMEIMFKDYIPFGSGLGSFGTAAAAKEYSPLYYDYQLNNVWGLTPENPMFLADAFYPTLAEFGIGGLFFFLWFWKRRLWECNKIPNIVYYRMALMAILTLALESTADSSYLSGKGMGYFMVLALCLNSGRQQMNCSKRSLR
ncbi:hypothetical protein KSW79_12635 [Prevotella copri]|uniref:hypothetical protein n=1 Tax=Segatella copri TaxID=165179 RepID=UPI001C386D7D|nr:hypothetical protein [Segatella copri]MBV3415232.1 hypothetical protein [Segatella copri]